MSSVVVALTLAAIAPVGGQTPALAPAHDSVQPAVARLNQDAMLNQIPPGRPWDAAPWPRQPEILAPSATGPERFEAPATAWTPILPVGGAALTDAAPAPPSAQLMASQPAGLTVAPPSDVPRVEVQAVAPPALAPTVGKEPFARQVAKCEPAPRETLGFQVSGALTFTYTDAANPATAGGSNYTGPGFGQPQTTEPGLELCLTLTPIPSVSFFTDITAKAPSDSAASITIERLFVDLRTALGPQGLGFRVGRDRITLGPLGLLLDEVEFEDQRDGFAVWLPAIGPVRISGFYQYALLDRSTTRRVWGGRAEAEVFPGWTLGANYRADIAAAGDTGPCPSSDCATGSGFGVDLEGKIVSGLTLTMAYVSYTQNRDVARNYYQAELAVDLKDLAGIRQFEPVLTIWYKNFDPYTMPGADGTVPRGNFLTPDDFKLFNINDNLTAVGASLELQLLSNVGFLVIGEWGTYKNSGPSYSVYSAGLEFFFPENITVKLTYNAYTVAGGFVETSPISGIELSNATVYQIEVVKSW